MSSFELTTGRLLYDALDLWVTVPPYRHFPCETINYRLFPAVHFDKIIAFYDEFEDCKFLRGFVTYAFMTKREFHSRIYWGWEIFAREEDDEDSEMLVFVDMIAPGGKNDVLSMCRDVRRLFKEKYPHVKNVYAHRGPRNGVFPNKGG